MTPIHPMEDTGIPKKTALRALQRENRKLTQARREMIIARLLRFKWHKWSKLP